MSGAATVANTSGSSKVLFNFLQARHLSETLRELQLLRVTRDVQAALIAAPLPAKKSKGAALPVPSASAQEISNLENSLDHAAK